MLKFALNIIKIISTLTMSTTPKQIFILSGQSNMSGRGGVSNWKWDHKIPPECSPSPSILRLTSDLAWVTAVEPLHIDIDTKKPCGLGPGMPFAKKVLDAVGREEEVVLGLVPCAIGGTRIVEWEKGMDLYERMVRRGRKAKEGGVVKAVLWFQGESDTSAKEDAELYKGRMERLVEDLRADLQDPHLLIIQVAIASGGKYIEAVRQAQLSIKLPNVICVDAKGLPLQSDGLHLSTEAQVQLGHILADAYLNHLKCCH